MEDVKEWLSSQVADFFDIGVQKPIPGYDTCLSSGGDYVKKHLKNVHMFIHIKIFFFS
jgi:hypothetical protein